MAMLHAQSYAHSTLHLVQCHWDCRGITSSLVSGASLRLLSHADLAPCLLPLSDLQPSWHWFRLTLARMAWQVVIARRPPVICSCNKCDQDSRPAAAWRTLSWAPQPLVLLCKVDYRPPTEAIQCSITSSRLIAISSSFPTTRNIGSELGTQSATSGTTHCVQCRSTTFRLLFQRLGEAIRLL